MALQASHLCTVCVSKLVNKQTKKKFGKSTKRTNRSIIGKTHLNDSEKKEESVIINFREDPSKRKPLILISKSKEPADTNFRPEESRVFGKNEQKKKANEDSFNRRNANQLSDHIALFANPSKSAASNEFSDHRKAKEANGDSSDFTFIDKKKNVDDTLSKDANPGGN